MPTRVGAKQSPTLLRIEAASGFKPRRRNTMWKGEWKTGDDAPVSIEESSGNVFADLGLKNPEELLAKAQLVQPIPVSTANVTNAQSIAPEKK
jgi:hypothetical protein